MSPDSEILIYPDPRLLQVSTPVDHMANAALFAGKMYNLMQGDVKSVGVAAPQLGLFEQIVVIDCRFSRRACENHGHLVLLNPDITYFSEEKDYGQEGCLSVPDWVGNVKRAREVTVRYTDLRGLRQTMDATGFEARVVQHEVDHLHGILFIERVRSARHLKPRL